METFCVFEHSKKNLLHQILAKRAIPRHPQQVSKQSNMMALEKQSELGGIAPLDELHQRRISLRFQSPSPSNTGQASKGYKEIEVRPEIPGRDVLLGAAWNGCDLPLVVFYKRGKSRVAVERDKIGIFSIEAMSENPSAIDSLKDDKARSGFPKSASIQARLYRLPTIFE